MPVVRLRSTRVDTAPLPGVRKQAAETAISAGAGVEQAKADKGDAIARFGNTIARVGSDQAGYVAQQARAAKEKADQTALLAAQGQLDAWELSTLHDPKTGAFNLHGDAAFALPEQVDEGFNKVTGEITQNLHTDEQRQAFARVVGQRKQQIAVAVRRHVSEEIERYDGEQLKSTLSNAASLAAVNALDPLRVSQELQRGEGAIATAAAQYHVPEEAKQAQLLAFRTDTHIGVINNLLANDQHQQASDYFEEVKDQIAGDKVDQVTRAVHEGSTRGEAQQASDAIIKEGGTLTEQRDKAKQIQNPEVRDQALHYIDEEDTLRARAERDQNEATLRGVYDILDKTHSVTKIPPAVWSGMTGGQRESARSYAKSLAEAGPGAIKTDSAELYKLLTLSSTDEKAFLQTNLLAYKTKLSAGDLEQLMRQQATMRAGKKEGTEFFASEKIQNDMVDEGIRAMYGIEPTTSEIKKKEAEIPQLQARIDQFRRSVREAVARKEAQSGKKATEADVQSVVDTLSATIGPRVTKTGIFSNSYTTSYAFETAQAKVTTIGQVPQSEQRKIKAALLARGFTPTDTAVINLFNENLSRVRKDK